MWVYILHIETMSSSILSISEDEARITQGLLTKAEGPSSQNRTLLVSSDGNIIMRTHVSPNRNYYQWGPSPFHGNPFVCTQVLPQAPEQNPIKVKMQQFH